MGLKRQDLSGNQIKILELLLEADSTGLTRSELAKKMEGWPMARGTLSSALNRLYAGYGLVDEPDRYAAQWKINAAGRRILGGEERMEEKKTYTAEDTAEEKQPEPSGAAAVDPDPAADLLLDAMEVEVALDQVVNRLRAPLITARSARVYQRILSGLPAVLVAELAPITDMVKVCQ